MIKKCFAVEVQIVYECRMAMYLSAVFSNPRTQIEIFLSFMVMICVEHNIAISTVKFANVFCRNCTLLTAIDSPNLEKSLKSSKHFQVRKCRFFFLQNCKINTSSFPPPSSNGGTSSTTGAAPLVAAFTPPPCCFSKAESFRSNHKSTHQWTRQQVSTTSGLRHTCYFPPSLLNNRSSWRHWPGVKLGLEIVILVALNNPNNLCRFWSILASNELLKFVTWLWEIKSWWIFEYKDGRLNFHLCSLTSSFSLVYLSYTSDPNEYLVATIQ